MMLLCTVAPVISYQYRCPGILPVRVMDTKLADKGIANDKARVLLVQMHEQNINKDSEPISLDQNLSRDPKLNLNQ
jgi:hypothetical protein